MLVPINWLKEFVELTASPDEVAARLTMAGLEVEGMEMVNDDVVLEVNVTPNRPDCLSILGIAREAAAAFKLPLLIPDSPVKDEVREPRFTVTIDDPGLCGRYAGRLITGVRTGDSPSWIKERLEKCGIRALNNNIVDVTNYVLLEFGHPLHAFDADKLAGGMIRVGRAGGNNKIKTLDEAERSLPEDALLIWDRDVPVAIAGIMGGEGSSVSDGTKNVFLESAYFEPSSIRRTSKKIGLRSESSYRFERGTDIVFLEQALNRAAFLIKETGGGAIHSLVDTYPRGYEQRKIQVSYHRVNGVLGTDIAGDEMRDLLESIGIVTEDMGESFFAYPPSFRGDIAVFVDIVEEVARLTGFSNIPVRVPRSALSEGIINRRESFVRSVRELMKKSGFNEVINYSFMNTDDLDVLLIGQDDRRRRCVTLRNPLRQEESAMRTTLIPSLINNFLYNLARGGRDIRLFEAARTYIEGQGQLPDEGLKLGGIYYRDNTPALWKNNAPPFFVVKGILQNLFSELKTGTPEFSPSAEPFLHPGKSADILLGGQRVGFMGELSPRVTDRLDLKVQKPEIMVFEIDLDVLFSGIPERIVFAQIPKYPAVERDVALLVPETVSCEGILEVIRSFESDFIEQVEPFDFYKGKNIPSDRKSLAFRIVYRAKDRTLTDAEVEQFHGALVEHISRETGAELRSK